VPQKLGHNNIYDNFANGRLITITMIARSIHSENRRENQIVIFTDTLVVQVEQLV